MSQKFVFRLQELMMSTVVERNVAIATSRTYYLSVCNVCSRHSLESRSGQ